jgi:transposase-like protein
MLGFGCLGELAFAEAPSQAVVTEEEVFGGRDWRSQHWRLKKKKEEEKELPTVPEKKEEIVVEILKDPGKKVPVESVKIPPNTAVKRLRKALKKALGEFKSSTVPQTPTVKITIPVVPKDTPNYDHIHKDDEEAIKAIISLIPRLIPITK